MNFCPHREAIAGAVVEAAQGMDAWSKKLQELKHGFLSEGLDTQAVDLMLGFDVVSSSLPVSRLLSLADAVSQTQSPCTKACAPPSIQSKPASSTENLGDGGVFAAHRCTGATQTRYRKISARTRACPMR
eukprot:COSAG02_NODE_322_length_24779_cov_14.118233_17_plen_130_part_00